MNERPGVRGENAAAKRIAVQAGWVVLATEYDELDSK
jgi:hypothetical protein